VRWDLADHGVGDFAGRTRTSKGDLPTRQARRPGWSDPERSRRFVWMINRMIKQASQSRADLRWSTILGSNFYATIGG
jgi:hypothetical protein